MSDKGLSENDFVVTAKELSLILGVSTSRIRQLHAEKALVRVSHGKYDLAASIQAYLEYITERNKTEEEVDKAKEEALLTRAKRLKAELELKIIQGEVHRSEDVESVMNDMLASFRSQLLILPGKVAPLVLGKTDLEVVKSTIRKYVYEALQELSEYDPQIFYAKSKDKLSVDDDLEEKGEEKEKAEKGPQTSEQKEN